MATEETKPVEREAFEMWVKSLPKCVGDSGSCDGSLVGLEHEPHCPMYGKQFATGEDAFNAGFGAALERAREAMRQKAFELRNERINTVTINDLDDALLALKGSR